MIKYVPLIKIKYIKKRGQNRTNINDKIKSNKENFFH